jgi:hypothetical protein
MTNTDVVVAGVVAVVVVVKVVVDRYCEKDRSLARLGSTSIQDETFADGRTRTIKDFPLSFST